MQFLSFHVESVFKYAYRESKSFNAFSNRIFFSKLGPNFTFWMENSYHFRLSKTLVCLSARQTLSQGPSILFWPINLDTVLTEGWASSASAPPLCSRLLEALMMMNVPTFGTSSKSMQMPLWQSGIFYVELTSFDEFQCQSLTKIWCMSY